jgi:GMP synthase-like glutamine amidotransferase
MHMRVHYLQHVHFEGPAAIEQWAQEAGHRITGSHLYRGDLLPDAADFDLLVIMGGPMSVNDEREFSWLIEEKELIRRTMALGCPVLGVCLGAQLIASAAGARVYRGPQKEIGWFPVRRVTTEGVGALLPELFTPLHWHGETFDLPEGATRLAETEVIPNQAFQLGCAVALQFHIEATPQSVAALVENAAHEIQPHMPFQQAPHAIVLDTPAASTAARPILWTLLNHLAGS